MLRKLNQAFARRFICPIRGHRYDTPDFTVNSLYHCSRCGKEMLDRSLADLRLLPSLTDEQMDAQLRELE